MTSRLILFRGLFEMTGAFLLNSRLVSCYNKANRGGIQMDYRKKLYRSRRDKQIAGVCGGLGEYFDRDSNVIRLLFLATLLLGGSGLILYIAAWMIIPEEPVEKEDEHQYLPGE